MGGVMLDKSRMRQHHLEVTYVLGRFMTEHFIRVYKAFDGDLTAAIVLGTIGQYNCRRYYTEVGAKAAEGFHRLAERGEHLPHARPCNAMSISQSTGILPGQRTSIGTRTPPSQVVIFSERNGVVPPWGNVECSTPLSLE